MWVPPRPDPDITKIPAIMRSKGWYNGARLQDIWFRGPANSVAERGKPDTTTIRMDTWALRFPRAKAVYDRMISEKIWLKLEAQMKIGKLLSKKIF
jgi:hypothetical protein